MKKRLAAVLIAVAVVTTGCSSKIETSLLEWVGETGLPLVLQDTTESLSSAAQKLQELPLTADNADEIVMALKASGLALSAQATAIANEPLSNDVAFEELRANAVTSIRDFVGRTDALDAAAIVASGDLAQLAAAITLLTGIATSLTALTKYVDTNGGEQVEPAEG